MMDSRLRVGLVGCGNISSEYLRTLSGTSVPVRVTACADRIPARARACAGRFGILALEPEALLASPEVDIVLNLTPPAAHYAVSLAAIRAGKHVYSEKPLAATFEEGKALLEAARQHDVLIGCAPDTFLGQGIQTCRQVIAAGRIGLPVAATAFMVCHGHEDWHPAPDFYYQPGGGPLFDMGPYYLTALVHLLGSLRRVGAFARASFPQRTVASVPGQERILEVAVHTHYAASLEFETGALATLVMSFDVWQANLPHLEIYGSQGSLFCPDPNTFAG
ncbi:MAG: Gfo/Idh/MocA family oxidoreductase, partial [Anaerolineae bacterium]|nr:Gfo/Idh/MocA family oxidoreductase [Anaerolineae bacterium]